MTHPVGNRQTTNSPTSSGSSEKNTHTTPSKTITEIVNEDENNKSSLNNYIDDVIKVLPNLAKDGIYGKIMNDANDTSFLNVKNVKTSWQDIETSLRCCGILLDSAKSAVSNLAGLTLEKRM